MTIAERKAVENQATTLISSINTHYKPEFSASFLELHGGSPTSVSSWELEAMLDDLLTIENDSD